MIQLKYKTRGNTQPNGKSKVLFTCHPADFSVYFDEISNQILNKQDCAVWYAGEVFSRDEDYFDILRQMQLLVMPVTSNLLNDPNDALDEDFRFAIENHIPVLPLMQESGLEKLFNQKCGDLQFLDQNIIDETAISYEEKLEKYLSSVLLSNIDAEKIRAAFDAYIFLSYRKKDRKYAQELMRLIHQNPLLWNIAIWYDEFLVPGENFNDAIRNAIEKSNLFVLAVTPNMVNETNYVMTTEYPLAQTIGKPMLACELLPTDADSLANQFKGLPACLDPRNTEMLDSALNTALQLDKTEHTDPTHTFFLGLAYLGGVDVETDVDRSAELITRAAEANLPEAINKLIAMYTNGQGVARDYVKAYEWIEKRYELAKQSCPENATPEQLHQLFLDTITYLSDIRKIDPYNRQSMQLTYVAERLAQVGANDTRCLHDLSVCYMRLSYAQNVDGLNLCYKALNIRLALDAQGRTLQTQRDIAATLGRLRILDVQNQRQHTESLISLQKSIATQSMQMDDIQEWSRLCKETDDLLQLRQACDYGKRVASCSGAEDDWKKLVDMLKSLEGKTNDDQDMLQVLDAKIKLAEISPSANNRRMLALQYDTVGNRLSRSKGKLHALVYYKHAYDLCSDLPVDPLCSVFLPSVCLKLAEGMFFNGDEEAALFYANHTLDNINKIQSTSFYAKTISEILSRLSILFGLLEQYNQMQMCKTEKKGLPSTEPYPQRLLEAEKLATQGREMARKGRYLDAYEIYAQAIALTDLQLEQDSSINAILTQAGQCTTMARISQRVVNCEEKYWHLRHIALCRQLVELDYNNHIHYLSGSYQKIGMYYARNLDYTKAEEAYRQAIDIIETNPNKKSDDYRCLAGYYNDLEKIFSNLCQWDVAKMHKDNYLKYRTIADEMRKQEESELSAKYGSLL